MRAIAVTGASSYLGRVLIPALESSGVASRIVGIDTQEPDFPTRALEFYRLDVRSSDVEQVLTGCDALVHLNFAASGSEDELRDVNIGGTRLIIEAAERAGVNRIVHVSSTTVYGAHADNDFPLTEESPVRPVSGDVRSELRAESDQMVREFARTHPAVVVTTLRLAPMLGPQVSGAAARLIETRAVITVNGYDPPLQVAHEDDVAGAIVFALGEDLTGVYNVVGGGRIPLSRALGLLGQRRVVLDHDRARRRLARLARLGLTEVTRETLPFLMYPCVASASKLAGAGFEPRHDVEATLRAAAQARKEWVAVGRFDFRPKRVALVAASLGAVAVGSAARAAVGRRGTNSTQPEERF